MSVPAQAPGEMRLVGGAESFGGGDGGSSSGFVYGGGGGLHDEIVVVFIDEKNFCSKLVSFF